MRLLPVLVAVVVLAACTGRTDTTSTSASVSTSTASTTTSTVTTSSATSPTPCAAPGRPFAGNGNVGGVTRDDTDAALLQEIRWQAFPGCERFSVAFATAEGAPAVTPPGVAGVLMRDQGVLRLAFGPQVTVSTIADQTVGTDLVRSAYVVRALDGSLFVDLQLAVPVEARAGSASSPARAVVELRPGGEPYPSTPATTSDLVLLAPTRGAVRYPFSVSGYARTGDTSITGTITGADGTSATKSSSVADQRYTWGAFILLFPDGPTGLVTLRVGNVQVLLTAS